MAKAYQYDAGGYYAGELEDYGLLPNNATYAAPLEREGFIPRWNGHIWEPVENHQGRQGYLQGQPHTIKEYGPLPEGWSDDAPEPSLEEAREAKWAEIVAGQATIMAEIKRAYPEDEREGWPYKLTEAEAILSGKAVVTPYIDAEVAGSGALYGSREDLAGQILKNNAAFKALSGFINGQQAALYHALEELTTREGVSVREIQDFTVEYKLPEEATSNMDFGSASDGLFKKLFSRLAS